MAGGGKDANASQFYITTGTDLDSLDEKHTLFGEVCTSVVLPLCCGGLHCASPSPACERLYKKHAKFGDVGQRSVADNVTLKTLNPSALPRSPKAWTCWKPLMTPSWTITAARCRCARVS